MTKTSRKTQSAAKGTQDIDGFDETYQVGSFFLGRKGRFTYMENLATPEQHKAAMQELHDSLGEHKEDIEKQILELEEIIKKYHPFDLIGNMAFRNSIINFDEYKEYESEQNPVYAEYIALLYLCQERDAYTDAVLPIAPSVIEDIQKRVRKLFSLQIFYLAFKNINPADPEPSILDELRFQTLLKSFLIGDMAYPHHRVELTREVFGNVKEEIKNIFGFTVDDVVRIADGIQEFITERLFSRREEILSFVRGLLKAIKVYRLKKRVSDEYPADVIIELGSLPPSEAKKRAMNMAVSWVFFGLGKTLAFTVDDLASKTKLDPSIVDKYLSLFSLEFGKVDSKFYRYPAPTHPLRTKPIIKVGTEYFCPVPSSIHPNLRLGLEEYLNPENKNAINKSIDIWRKYEQGRANYLEERALGYLGSSLRYAKSYRNLKYTIKEGDKEKEVELDGLLQIDDTLFIVEAKSGTLSQPARRGAPSLVEDIQELVGNAYQQSLRAKQYIVGNQKPEFRLSDGSKVTIAKETLDRIFLVNVTLENMESFIVNLYKLRKLGVLSESEFPWSVSVTDLRVISEIVSTSGEFVHYLLRRLRINDLAFIEAHDELDWFGHYLHEGLYFDHFTAPAQGERRLMTLGTYTTTLDDYYYHQLGLLQKQAPKPEQPMPEIFREIINYLDSTHTEGYLKAALALLDMGDESRQDFAQYFKELRRKAIHDRNIHDFTMGFQESSTGITFMTAPREKFRELGDQLNYYSFAKKYQTGLALWIGLGNIADSNAIISYVFVHDQPIEHNPETDEQIRKLFSPQ
jgi:hypothetical protein